MSPMNPLLKSLHCLRLWLRVLHPAPVPAQASGQRLEIGVALVAEPQLLLPALCPHVLCPANVWPVANSQSFQCHADTSAQARVRLAHCFLRRSLSPTGKPLPLWQDSLYPDTARTQDMLPRPCHPVPQRPGSSVPLPNEVPPDTNSPRGPASAASLTGSPQRERIGFSPPWHAMG